MRFSRPKGFTLIEVIVVIGIIAVISAVVVVVMSGARMKARDSRRVASISEIKQALELYFLQNGIYPTSLTAGQALTADGRIYIDRIPSNPAPRTDGGCIDQDFKYTVGPRNADYSLGFCLGTASGSFAAGPNSCTAWAGGCNVVLPNQISGLLTWFRADSLALNDGDPVTSWTDLSANNNHATVSALLTARQPKYKANVLNRKPVIRFDGDDWLTLGSNVTTVRTVFILEKWDSSFSGALYPPLLGSSTVYDFHGNTETGGATDGIFIVSYTSANIKSGTVWNNGTSVAPLSLYKDRNNFQLIELQTIGTVQFNTLSNDRGGANNFHGDMAELIVYDSVISTADRQKVEKYLARKYNLTIAGITY